MDLKIQNLTKIFQHPVDTELNFAILSDINIHLTSENPMIVIRGESGVGKTTLLELIIGFKTPSAGKIIFNGNVVNTLKGRKKKLFTSQIGYINQFPQDMVDFRISPADNCKLVGAEIDEKMLVKLGIDHIFEKDLRTYSGGELRRFIVARELGRKPKLLICDEPTAHLDTKSSRIVWKTILDYVENNNSLAIISTHDPEISYKNTLVLEKKGWK